MNAPDSVSVAGPLLERIVGYARMQSGDLEGAEVAFGSSLATARERGAEFEVAMSLRAFAQLHLARGSTGEVELAEARGIYERLKVIAAPVVPMDRRRVPRHERRSVRAAPLDLAVGPIYRL